MPKPLEAMADQIVTSGKLRINADTERNFVRLGSRANDRTLSARELTDPKLAATTRRELARYIAPAEGEAGLQAMLQRLQADLKKARGIAEEKERQVARVLVQSAHPAVIAQLIRSGTEIFVSYSHNVSDLMPVHQWETHGTANGMQATDGRAAAVYVSAGGDPFFDGKENEKYYVTDGFPALARMVVIAGQELGHFADLKRRAGKVVGRHSLDANSTQMRADPIAREARLADMRCTAQLTQTYQRCGLAALQNAERRFAFYHARRRYSLPWMFTGIWRMIRLGWFLMQCNKRGICQRLRTYPPYPRGEATGLWLTDMAFNLAPDAESYRHPDPLVEEAIAVIEAVARVPQQVNKWGHAATRRAWPNLYRFYYDQVIADLEKV